MTNVWWFSNDTWIVSGTAAAALEATDVDGNGGTDTFSIVNTTAITAVIDFSVVSEAEQAVQQKTPTVLLILILVLPYQLMFHHKYLLLMPLLLYLQLVH